MPDLLLHRPVVADLPAAGPEATPPLAVDARGLAAPKLPKFFDRLVQPPLAVDARGLAALLSSSIRWVRAQDAAGKLPAPVRCAGRVLWIRSEIEAWLTAGAPDRETWAARTAARR